MLAAACNVPQQYCCMLVSLSDFVALQNLVHAGAVISPAQQECSSECNCALADTYAIALAHHHAEACNISAVKPTDIDTK